MSPNTSAESRWTTWTSSSPTSPRTVHEAAAAHRWAVAAGTRPRVGLRLGMPDVRAAAPSDYSVRLGPHTEHHRKRHRFRPSGVRSTSRRIVNVVVHFYYSILEASMSVKA